MTAIPIAIPGSPLSPYSSSPRSPSTRTFTPNSSRRLSAGQQHSPSLPFVGSFENSLLAGRFSSQPSNPVHFLASLGVLGDATENNKLRCPPHLNLPFDAFFYSSDSTHRDRGSPYVGTIDLESHYFQLLSNWAITPSTLDSPSSPTPSQSGAPIPTSIPKFPGYRVPKKGRIQLVVKYPNSVAIKLFLCQYDLTGLDREGQGGKTFVRQKSYTVESEGGNRLRYAIHLQFCSPPTASSPANLPGFRTSSPATPKSSPRYYLHKSIRVVFASSAMNLAEKLVVASEGPEGADGGTREGFAPYSGPGENWEMVRQKAKLRIQGLRVENGGSSNRLATSTRSEEGNLNISPVIPSPPSLASLSLSEAFSYLPPSPTSPLRSILSSSLLRPFPTPSTPELADPIFPRQIDRAISPALSGLSSSRPSSRIAGRSNRKETDDVARRMEEDALNSSRNPDGVSERLGEDVEEEVRRMRLIGR